MFEPIDSALRTKPTELDVNNENDPNNTNDTESRLIEEVAADTVTLQDRRYPEPTPILRGVHPKSHGCLKGSFTINPDIPEDLRVGLFAEPGKCHEAVVRYSNAAVKVECDLKDGKNGSRGMAIKVMGVDSEVLQMDGEGASQDFLMVNTRMFAFANVRDYHRLTKILLQHDDSPAAFFAPLQMEVPGITPEDKARVFKSFKVVQTIEAIPVRNPLEVAYFGAAPFGFGPDRVMRFKAQPRVAPEPQIAPDEPGCDYLNDALTARMTDDEVVVFDFLLQVRDAEDVKDLEDATSFWDEAETPFVPVATLVLEAPQTDVNSDAQRQACEDLVFTPWHALTEHEPLGGINRLRKKVYDASAEHRCPVKHD